MSSFNPVESIEDRPQFSVREATELAARVFDCRGELSSLPSERDQNFRVITEDDGEYVLKIANLASAIDIIDCQNDAMLHVDRIVQDSICPKPIASRDGEYLAAEKDASQQDCFVRLVPYLPGIPLGELSWHSPELLEELGRSVGRVTAALVSFSDDRAKRELRWDLRKAVSVIDDCIGLLNAEQRLMIDPIRHEYSSIVTPFDQSLRFSVIHGDANDYNLIVGIDELGRKSSVNLIDFGDMVWSHTVNDLAILIAYVMLDKPDPIESAAKVVSGFHESLPLEEREVELLFTLARTRLAVSVSLAAKQSLASQDEYLTVTQAPAWRTLARLKDVDARLAHYRFRSACGWEACPISAHVQNWIQANQTKLKPVIQLDDADSCFPVIDFSVESTQFGSDTLKGRFSTPELTDASHAFGSDQSNASGGRYGEARICYAGDQFSQSAMNELEEVSSSIANVPRTRHLGIDLFAPAGTSVCAPLDGRVVCLHDNALAYDYGPTIILEHSCELGGNASNVTFYTLYGHLSRESLELLQPGAEIAAGQTFASLGTAIVNGGWPPHLHFQLICDRLDYTNDFPGVARFDQWDLWSSLSPNPASFFSSVEPRRLTWCDVDAEELTHERTQSLSTSLSLSYRKPLHIVRGIGAYLYDRNGLAYLDCVNNVCHVGHCHPHVVEQLSRQAQTLNTNTRYLHANLVEYAARLCSLFSDPLSVCFLVNSGSEANDLALRLARTKTGSCETIVVDGAYHGNLSSLIEISPYKHAGPGGQGAPDHVHVLDMPDLYRGTFRENDELAVSKYVSNARDLIARLASEDRHPGVFIAESILSCGGQIVLPEGYLSQLYDLVRSAGGVCIADEVQVGFGRVGERFWGFELQDVIPDIVTLGKPIGNGHPLAAVITTPDIAYAFDNGMEYFNTFGGNPVSAAVGNAVLDVIDREQLQQRALTVGNCLKDGLLSLKEKYESIGDVRGKGLFLGIEFVTDRSTRAPHPLLAAHVVHRANAARVLLSTDGPDHNVIKIKPPLAFSQSDAERVVAVIDWAMKDQIFE